MRIGECRARNEGKNISFPTSRPILGAKELIKRSSVTDFNVENFLVCEGC